VSLLLLVEHRLLGLPLVSVVSFNQQTAGNLISGQ
jgi:hypothetical protein